LLPFRWRSDHTIQKDLPSLAIHFGAMIGM
jgi:hypothetical protein